MEITYTDWVKGYSPLMEANDVVFVDDISLAEKYVNGNMKRIWTRCYYEGYCILNGYHLANQDGYTVTQNEWDEGYDILVLPDEAEVIDKKEKLTTIEIAIENPILLELLEKSKMMGLFGDCLPEFGIGEYRSSSPGWSRSAETELIAIPALYYYENFDLREISLTNLPLVKVWPKKLSDNSSFVMEFLKLNGHYFSCTLRAHS